MPSKDYQRPEEQASQQQASQQQTDQQSQQSGPTGPAPDTSQLLATLSQVFATFQNQLQSQAPKPFDGNSKVAVDVFNDILLALQLKFPPNPPSLAAETVSSTEIKLTWSDNTNNADGFKVLRCQGQGCQNFAELGGPLPSAVREYTDVNLPSRTTYRYKLIAFNVLGEATSLSSDATTGA